MTPYREHAEQPSEPVPIQRFSRADEIRAGALPFGFEGLRRAGYALRGECPGCGVPESATRCRADCAAAWRMLLGLPPRVAG